MKTTERARTYVLYHNEDRVFNQFDRNDGGLAGQYGGKISDNPPEKWLLREERRDGVAPVDKFPVGIVFDNVTSYNDGASDGEEHKHLYAVPLFSYQVVQQLEGRLLDYIDATYAEKEQREAQKRVLRKILWGYHDELLNARKTTYERSKPVVATK